MKTRKKVHGMLEKNLEDPTYRKHFEEGYEAFELEVQILNALEARDWTFARLAEATQTSKSNISRDLSGGGLLRATLARIRRIADALGMRLVMLLIPKEQAHFIVPKLEDIARSSFNAAHGGFPVAPLAVTGGPALGGTANGALYFTTAQSTSNIRPELAGAPIR